MKQFSIFLCSICFISCEKLLLLLLMTYLTRAMNKHFRKDTANLTKKKFSQSVSFLFSRDLLTDCGEQTKQTAASSTAIPL